MLLANPSAQSSVIGGPWVEISLSNLSRNLTLVRQMVPISKRIAPVVKGDAYGHGLIPVAKQFARDGVHGLCVAAPSEGVELRRAGIDLPIYVLGASLEDGLQQCINEGLTPSITSWEAAVALDGIAKANQTRVSTHARIDVGLGSMGIPVKQFFNELARLTSLPHIQITGLFTQLSAAYSGDDAALEEQLRQFSEVVCKARESGFHGQTHAASSPALAKQAGLEHDMIRPGIILYGLPYGPELQGFQPVMSLKSKIVDITHLHAGANLGYHDDTKLLEDRILASVAIGYADALFLHFIQHGQVLVQGRRASIVGHAYMDHLVIDVTSIPKVTLGEEVVLLGRQGAAQITAAELANWSGIGVENSDRLTLLGPRVQRVYTRNASPEVVVP